MKGLNQVVFRIVFGIVLLSNFAVAVSAQQTAELNGTITDPTGAALAGAKVTVTNIDTGVARDTVVDTLGSYLFTLLQPGFYSLTAEAAGFKRVVRGRFELQVNQRATINLNLEVGNVNESVAVTGTAPLLESQSSSLGSVTDTKLVGELPLNGRNFVQLATLAPGVSGVGYSVTGTIMGGGKPDDRRPGTEIFSNGNREGSNNFLYDGIDDNDRLTLSIVLRPPVEAIREFKVQTSMYSADQGRNSGAVVDVVTKSGTNQLHGSAFEFIRNSGVDARSFFNPAGTPFPPFRYNQFGGSLGGPVIIPKLYSRDRKTFFFVDYEGFRRTSLSQLLVTVPTLAERTGNFSGIKALIYDPTTTTQNSTGAFVRTPFLNNSIPASKFDPLTQILVNAYPTPTTSALANNYTSNLLQTQGWDQGDVRVDQQIGSNDTFFARWSRQQTTTVVPSTYPATTLPGLSQPIALGNEDSFAGTDVQNANHAVASYVHIFSPRLVNELRGGFNRFFTNYDLEGVSPGSNFGSKFGIPNANNATRSTGFTIFSPASYGGIGQSRSLPILRTENLYELIDNLTFTVGKHTLKIGEDFRRRQLSDLQTNSGNGRFNFSTGFTSQPGVNGTGDSIASLLLGYPTLIQQDFMLAYPGLRGIENGIYFADDWRVTKRLTFNIGLRWEYYSPYHEVANRIANFNPATVSMMVAGQNGVSSTANVLADWKDFAPRFGFAYQVLSHTVIRGGFGLFYNPNGDDGGTLKLFRTPPYGPIYLVSTGDLIPGQRVSNGFPAAPTVNIAAAQSPATLSGGVIGVATDYKHAYAQQYNLTVEEEIPSISSLLRVAFVGNLGRRLGTNFNLNQPVPGSTALNSRRPFFAIDPNLADVTYAVTDGLSNYSALQVSFEKRLSHGLAMLVGYTYSHAIDNIGTQFGGGTGTPQDPRYRNLDRGNSSFDLRQRFTLGYTYSLPGPKKGLLGLLLGNWQQNAILISQSGLPYTPTLATTTVNTGTASRPNCVVNPAPLANGPTLQQWFNPANFVSPPAFTYGNCGRNILYGPGRTNIDASIFKDFPIRESLRLQFRAEAFNIFNHPQFGQPNATVGSSSAGIISSIVGNPRQLQGSLRLVF